MNEGKERAEVTSVAEGTGRKREWPWAEQGLRVSGGRVGDGAKHGPEPRKGSGLRGP